MNDLGWIDPILGAARPRVMGALLRYFRTLDTAEEAFQEACLRALKSWPQVYQAIDGFAASLKGKTMVSV